MRTPLPSADVWIRDRDQQQSAHLHWRSTAPHISSHARGADMHAIWCGGVGVKASGTIMRRNQNLRFAHRAASPRDFLFDSCLYFL